MLEAGVAGWDAPWQEGTVPYGGTIGEEEEKEPFLCARWNEKTSPPSTWKAACIGSEKSDADSWPGKRDNGDDAAGSSGMVGYEHRGEGVDEEEGGQEVVVKVE